MTATRWPWPVVVAWLERSEVGAVVVTVPEVGPVDLVTYSGDCHVGAHELCELPCDCGCHVPAVERLIEQQ